ncbi:MAG: McrC family protein [Oscillospiraceae bacterium]
MIKLLTITEYETIYCGTQDNFEEKTISKKHFDSLESLILSKSNNDDTPQIMKISQVNHQKVIKAQQYVGLIQLKDGFQIEILPKIYDNDNIKDVKTILFEMLKSILNISYKKGNISNLDVDNITIFEVFIRMFIDEVKNIIDYGISSNYEEVFSNETFFNGKLLLEKHLLENRVHKERFFIQHDVFTPNCSENKIIKSTLMLLYSITQDSNNKKSIYQMLQYFDTVEPSKNYDLDFSRCRNNHTYDTILNIAKVFLQNKSFSNYHGDSITYALLFPMNDIFEKYVSNIIKKRYPQYDIAIQDSSKYLFENPKRFNLRPDIVLKEKSYVKYIIDTKWKILDHTKNNYGINIQDMYQMYVYSRAFNCNDIILLYPKPSHKIEETTYHTNDDVSIKVKFIDLYKIICNHKQSKI